MAEKQSDAAASEGRNYTEDASVDKTIEKAKGIEKGAVRELTTVQSTTAVTPSKADESSAPGPYQGADAPKVNDPPVRSGLPDVPVAQTLTEGAGAHTPPDPDEFDPQGRPAG
jgi:hypothetical protein